MKLSSSLHLAVDDLATGLSSVQVWAALGWQDVKQRYRRSQLGPFWLTISTGIMVAIMGPLYGKLFAQDFSSYFSFLTIGFVLWQMISQTMIDSCTTFIQAESFIKQIKLPLSVHVLRVVWKNLIFFMHNLVVVIVVLVYLQIPVTANLLLFPLGVVAFALNAFLYGLIIAVICARFRDIPIIVTNVVQAAFFLTPILWQPGMLGRHAWSVNLNPIYHFLEVMRAPLLGVPADPTSWAAVAAITLTGSLLAVAILKRYRARVPYWV